MIHRTRTGRNKRNTGTDALRNLYGSENRILYMEERLSENGSAVQKRVYPCRIPKI